jgi:hypothetical protein
MRTLICLGLFFLLPHAVKAQQFTLVQINAKWNEKNSVDVPCIDGVKYTYANLEDQNKNLRDKIKAVPVVILYKNNTPVYQWNANLSFELSLKEDDILEQINTWR